MPWILGKSELIDSSESAFEDQTHLPLAAMNIDDK
jgi:hypothetical protein